MVTGSHRGQGLTEYSILLSLVALACVAAVTLLGSSISGFYNAFAGMF